MKCRLSYPALAPPLLAFTGQHSPAKQQAVCPQSPPFDEAAGISDQHVLDVVRMAEQVAAEGEEAIADDIAVLASATRKEGQHIVSHVAEIPAQHASRGSRRSLVVCSKQCFPCP